MDLINYTKKSDNSLIIKTSNLKENNFDTKKAKIFTKNFYNFSNKNLQIPLVNQEFYDNNNLILSHENGDSENIKFRNSSYDFSNNEKIKEFFLNKEKIKQRLNSMYKDSLINLSKNNSLNSLGQRVLIKNPRGNVEEKFSKTSKVFY